MILNPELHWFFKHTNPGKECTVDWLGLNPRLGETRCCRTQKTSIRALHRPVQIIRWVQQAWTCESLELFFYVSLSSPRVSHPFCLGEDNSTGTVVRDRRVLFFYWKFNEKEGREAISVEKTFKIIMFSYHYIREIMDPQTGLSGIFKWTYRPLPRQSSWVFSLGWK